MTITEFLKTKVPFLAGITQDQAHALAVAAQQQLFAKGHTILFKGVSVEGLHVVAEGSVSVWVKGPKDKEGRKVASLGPGEVFGETSIVEFTMASATIKSEAEQTRLFVIPEKAFVQLMAEDTGLKDRVLALIEARKAGQIKPADTPADKKEEPKA